MRARVNIVFNLSNCFVNQVKFMRFLCYFGFPLLGDHARQTGKCRYSQTRVHVEILTLPAPLSGSSYEVLKIQLFELHAVDCTYNYTYRVFCGNVPNIKEENYVYVF